MTRVSDPGRARPRTVLLGGAGVVGAEVRRQLEARGGAELAACISRRGRNGTTALDVTDRGALAPVLAHADVVVHLVASTRWTLTPNDALAANVAPLEAVLDVLPERTTLIHLSTSYSDGVATGDAATRYRNTYEWSKARSEQVVRDRRPGAHLVRFPLVVGRVTDGRIERFTGIYTILQALTSGLLPAVIGEEHTPVDLAPVDVVADVVCQIVEGRRDAAVQSTPRGCVIGSGPAAPPVATLLASLVEPLNRWRTEQGLLPVDVPPVIPSESWHRFHRYFVWPHLGRAQRRAVELLEEFSPYLSDPLVAEPDVACPEILRALASSVRFWADANPRVASRQPRPWAAAGDGRIW